MNSLPLLKIPHHFIRLTSTFAVILGLCAAGLQAQSWASLSRGQVSDENTQSDFLRGFGIRSAVDTSTYSAEYSDLFDRAASGRLSLAQMATLMEFLNSKRSVENVAFSGMRIRGLGALELGLSKTLKRLSRGRLLLGDTRGLEDNKDLFRIYRSLGNSEVSSKVLPELYRALDSRTAEVDFMVLQEEPLAHHHHDGHAAFIRRIFESAGRRRGETLDIHGFTKVLEHHLYSNSRDPSSAQFAEHIADYLDGTFSRRDPRALSQRALVVRDRLAPILTYLRSMTLEGARREAQANLLQSLSMLFDATHRDWPTLGFNFLSRAMSGASVRERLTAYEFYSDLVEAYVGDQGWDSGVFPVPHGPSYQDAASLDFVVTDMRFEVGLLPRAVTTDLKPGLDRLQGKWVALTRYASRIRLSQDIQTWTKFDGLVRILAVSDRYAAYSIERRLIDARSALVAAFHKVQPKERAGTVLKALKMLPAMGDDAALMTALHEAIVDSDAGSRRVYQSSAYRDALEGPVTDAFKVYPADPLVLEKRALLAAAMQNPVSANPAHDEGSSITREERNTRINFAFHIAGVTPTVDSEGLIRFWQQFNTTAWAWPAVIESMERRIDAVLANDSSLTMDNLRTLSQILNVIRVDTNLRSRAFALHRRLQARAWQSASVDNLTAEARGDASSRVSLPWTNPNPEEAMDVLEARIKLIEAREVHALNPLVSLRMVPALRRDLNDLRERHRRRSSTDVDGYAADSRAVKALANISYWALHLVTPETEREALTQDPKERADFGPSSLWQNILEYSELPSSLYSVLEVQVAGWTRRNGSRSAHLDAQGPVAKARLAALRYAQEHRLDPKEVLTQLVGTSDVVRPPGFTSGPLPAAVIGAVRMAEIDERLVRDQAEQDLVADGDNPRGLMGIQNALRRLVVEEDLSYVKPSRLYGLTAGDQAGITMGQSMDPVADRLERVLERALEIVGPKLFPIVVNIHGIDFPENRGAHVEKRKNQIRNFIVRNISRFVDFTSLDAGKSTADAVDAIRFRINELMPNQIELPSASSIEEAIANLKGENTELVASAKQALAEAYLAHHGYALTMDGNRAQALMRALASKGKYLMTHVTADGIRVEYTARIHREKPQTGTLDALVNACRGAASFARGVAAAQRLRAP